MPYPSVRLLCPIFSASKENSQISKTLCNIVSVYTPWTNKKKELFGRRRREYNTDPVWGR
jgi:hypothetical protein